MLRKYKILYTQLLLLSAVLLPVMTDQLAYTINKVASM